jgi:hypothetical protein
MIRSSSTNLSLKHVQKQIWAMAANTSANGTATLEKVKGKKFSQMELSMKVLSTKIKKEDRVSSLGQTKNLITKENGETISSKATASSNGMTVESSMVNFTLTKLTERVP